MVRTQSTLDTLLIDFTLFEMEKLRDYTRQLGVKQNLQLADIGTKNVTENELQSRLSYLMVKVEP